jgi:hypothetical protein
VVETIIHGFVHGLAWDVIVLGHLVGRTRLGTKRRPVHDFREEITPSHEQLPVV